MSADARHQWTLDCGCFRCALINRMVMREAVASVALDRDPRAQTVTLEELEGRDA